jgi:hypothetical protein
VIDAGEDVQHSHAHELDEARALQAAPLASGHIHGPVFVRDQLFREFPGQRVLHLREIGVARHQVEEGRGMHLQVVRCGAFEREIDFSKAGSRRQGLNRRHHRAALPFSQGVYALGQVGLQAIVGWLARVVRHAVGLHDRNRHHQVDLVAFDLPDRMGLAAGVGIRRSAAQQRRRRQPD